MAKKKLELIPEISVIMPVYNAEAFVADAISSVLNQSFLNFELIIINDGSTDGSEQEILNFKDDRIVYLKQDNQGQVIASNNGIEIAKGHYIKFLDADDLINADHLKLQYEAINDDQSRLASCQWAVFYDNYQDITFNKEYTNKDYDNPMNWFYDVHHYDSGMLGAWLWLIPRHLLNKAGYWNENLSLNNDFDFSVRLLSASDGVNYAEGAKLYYRTGNQNALTHTKSRKGYESVLLTTVLAMNTILEVENTPRMRKLFADRFQAWYYQMYPQFSDIRGVVSQHLKDLGGSDLKPEGGRLFQLLNIFLPWKIVMWIQFLLHQTIWKPILRLKYKMKIKREFAG